MDKIRSFFASFECDEVLFSEKPYTLPTNEDLSKDMANFAEDLKLVGNDLKGGQNQSAEKKAKSNDTG